MSAVDELIRFHCSITIFVLLIQTYLIFYPGLQVGHDDLIRCFHFVNLLLHSPNKGFYGIRPDVQHLFQIGVLMYLSDESLAEMTQASECF